MSQLQQYEEFILSLPAGKLSKDQLLVPELLINQSGNMSVYYIPYDYVNTDARIMIIGITPGFTQMQLAFLQAREGLLNKIPYPEIDKQAKFVASFAGSMRSNLNEMLNEIGLPEALGIDRSESLFAENRDLLHTTSVIRYPVYHNGTNYTGHQPEIIKSDFLLAYARSILLEEVISVKDALILPLGKSVSDVLHMFVKEGLLNEERCLFDLPHPSGANGHRKKHFENSKSKLTEQINHWFK
ncbi:MAG: uracil-DNA glycosylase family protein [Candidatus Pristimantibacillus sp.]